MNVSIRPAFSITVVGVMLAACAEITDPSVGEGPITLSADAQQAFADYQALPNPRYFAVSENGDAYYYSYCDATRCLRQAKTKVIERCETFSNGAPCKIYGSHGTIVWVARPPR
ncbi:MAG: hypothetical protein R3F54_00035 [Alphaproteobacteria bacterium]